MEKKLFRSYCLMLFVFSSLFFISNKYMIILVYISSPFLLLLNFRYCLFCIQDLPNLNFKNFWFISGLIFVVGAFLFDLSITLFKNPDLSEEANIFSVVMLKHNVPVNLVVTLFVIFQFMMTVFVTLFWALAYKSFPVMIQNLENDNIFQKILKIHGIKKLTIRNFFFSMDEILYTNALFGVSMMGICINKIYCGLEWLELVPFSSWFSLIVSIVLSNGIYITYLLYRSKKPDNAVVHPKVSDM